MARKLMRRALEEMNKTLLLSVALEELADVHEGGCVAFDLDGTLAHYDGWKGEMHIGEPIAAMVERWKAYRDKGVKCIIFTARYSEDPAKEMAMKQIQAWAHQHLGEIPEITNEKTPNIVRIYDDRARQIIENTGEVVGEAI